MTRLSSISMNCIQLCEVRERLFSNFIVWNTNPIQFHDSSDFCGWFALSKLTTLVVILTQLLTNQGKCQKLAEHSFWCTEVSHCRSQFLRKSYAEANRATFRLKSQKKIMLSGGRPLTCRGPCWLPKNWIGDHGQENNARVLLTLDRDPSRTLQTDGLIQ
jgi:hypothetical protein